MRRTVFVNSGSIADPEHEHLSWAAAEASMARSSKPLPATASVR
jgi:hypothetical protein